MKKYFLVSLITLSLSLLSAGGGWMSINGLYQNYTQNGFYDSDIDKINEESYGGEFKIMTNGGLCFYGAVGLFFPQRLTYTYTNGAILGVDIDEVMNNGGLGMSNSAALGYNFRTDGTVKPYVAIGGNFSWIIMGNNYMSYGAELYGVMADLGMNIMMAERVAFVVGSELHSHFLVNETVTTSSSENITRSSITSLDVRPYIGIGIRFSSSTKSKSRYDWQLDAIKDALLKDDIEQAERIYALYFDSGDGANTNQALEAYQLIYNAKKKAS